MSEDLSAGPGFYGKVRTHGDFVTRRLPAEFVAPWDEGLQSGILLGRERFGEAWLPMYLNAPVWCFAVGPHVYGATAWAGVLMSGVDRVGRYFPFTIAQPFEADEFERHLPVAQAWYDRLMDLALATLAPEFALDEFDAALRALAWRSADHESELSAWRLAQRDAPGDGLVAWLMSAAAAGQSAWWSEGSPAVPASARRCTGATNGLQFASLLDLGADEWDSVVELTLNVNARSQVTSEGCAPGRISN